MMPRVIKNNKGKRRNHKPIVTCVPGVSEERGGEAERDLGGSSREGALKNGIECVRTASPTVSTNAWKVNRSGSDNRIASTPIRWAGGSIQGCFSEVVPTSKAIAIRPASWVTLYPIQRCSCSGASVIGCGAGGPTGSVYFHFPPDRGGVQDGTV